MRIELQFRLFSSVLRLTIILLLQSSAPLCLLFVETGEPREVHHFATLLGFGASAVNPYLAHEGIKYFVSSHMLDKDPYAAIDDYNKVVLNGIVKIAAKMGISTYSVIYQLQDF